jgi:hypothetical protein
MNTGQIVRSKSTNKFVSIPNSIAQGKDLSLGERGLMLYLLSLPNDWVVNKSNLHELVGEKKGTVDGVFKTLQLKGFIVSAKVVNEQGHFKGWNHVVYDEPILPDSENHRNRFLPKSETTDIGKSCSIQKTNLKGLQSTKETTNTVFEKFEENSKNDMPDFVEADRQKTREAKKDTGSAIFSIADLSSQLKQDRATCELFCMTYKISPEQVVAAIDSFANYLIMVGEEYTRSRFRSHFTNWLPKNLDKAKVSSKPLSKNESIDTRYLFGEPA